MKKWLLLSCPVVALVIATAGAASAQTCGLTNPATCSNSVSLSVKTVFVCTQVQVPSSQSNVNAQIFSITLNTDGSFSLVGASDGTQGSFTNFGTPITGTYCINNSNQTGYANPSAGCPLAMVLDNSKEEAHLIDTTNGNAEAVSCTAD